MMIDAAFAPAGSHRELEHVILFTGQSWALWRLSCLRAAGFPAHLALNLAVPACATAADAVLDARRRAADCKAETIATFQLALGRAEDKDKRETLSRALEEFDKGRVPHLVDAAVDDACRRLASACAQVDVAMERFKEEFDRGVRETSKAIRDVAHDPCFRQAALMQNRVAIEQLRRRLSAATSGERGKKVRECEKLVASYLQRYCVKNDTIGFFGPVGWAWLDRQTNGITVSPGPKLVATSSIYFENWCIEALAEKIAENPAVRPWIAPRRLPEFFLDGAMLYPPSGPPTTLAPQPLAILQLCDGERTARQIASALSGSLGFGGDNEVYRLLEELTKQKIVSWAYDLPMVLYPEKHLRQLLNRIDDVELRQSALDMLDRLEQARNEIAAAFGDADRLALAIAEMERVFENETRRSSNRSDGQMYASRTLFYQDCRRDVDIEIGPAVFEEIMTPLSLVLASARWFSHRVADTCRQAFIKAHHRLANGPAGAVEFLRFWKYAQFLLLSRSAANNMLAPIVEDLKGRWKQALGPLPQGRRVEFASAQLKPQVDALFAAPGPGWALARHHSPDVMIAADSVDAINRGECFFVLGETHVAANTLNISVIAAQHPRPNEFFHAMKSDFPEARLALTLPRTFPRRMNRLVEGWISPSNLQIEVSSDSICPGERSQAIPASSLVVKYLSDRVVVCTRDGRLEFDAIECFGELLTIASLVSLDYMKVFGPADYNPRIAIDRLVVSRESWRFSAKSVDFIREGRGHALFLQARRWMHDHQLTRFVFFKLPTEVKPFYLDFESPIYVEIFAKMLRRMLASDHADESIVFSEMLPAHGQLWLPDAKDNRYTSELRLVARDLLC